MDRQEARQWLKLLHSSPQIYGEHLEAIDMAIEALQFQDIMINSPKTAKPTPEVCKNCMEDDWIPVSKRLPDKDGWYLITVQGYEKVVDMEWYYSEWGAWNGVSSEQQVIAWMPLPEPYKGGDTE